MQFGSIDKLLFLIYLLLFFFFSSVNWSLSYLKSPQVTWILFQILANGCNVEVSMFSFLSLVSNSSGLFPSVFGTIPSELAIIDIIITL